MDYKPLDYGTSYEIEGANFTIETSQKYSGLDLEQLKTQFYKLRKRVKMLQRDYCIQNINMGNNSDSVAISNHKNLKS